METKQLRLFEDVPHYSDSSNTVKISRSNVHAGVQCVSSFSKKQSESTFYHFTKSHRITELIFGRYLIQDPR